MFVVHPLSYVFHHPLWLDEAWVATLAKAPWSRAYALSSSTPVGWLFLVRLVPGGRGEQLRVIPLLFAAGEVVVAYILVRGLPWESVGRARVAAAATGVVVLLAPVSLVRNDLKQYTADAFFALVILALASRAEGRPGTRTMTEFVAVTVVAALFSTVAAFVAVAALAGLLGAALLARSAARVRTVAVGGGVAIVGLAAYFAGVVLPHTSASLRSYWDDFYLPSSPLHALGDSWTRFYRLAPALGVPALVSVALFGAGCVVCARIGRPGLGLAFGLLWIEMLVVAMARRYPFLDLRTSHFLLVVSLVAITVGFVGLVGALASRYRLLVIVVCFLAATLFLHNSVPYVRARWLPNEDVRTAVAYVADHYRPGDVIVVSLPSSFGFSYYWPGAPIQYVKDDAVSMGFVTRVPGLRHVVYVGGLTPRDTTSAMRRALADAGPRSPRIWIIRTHLFDAEAASWERTFRALRLHPSVKQVGSEPLWIVG